MDDRKGVKPVVRDPDEPLGLLKPAYGEGGEGFTRAPEEEEKSRQPAATLRVLPTDEEVINQLLSPGFKLPTYE